MERPLESKRPLGPFAQSEAFRDTFLSQNEGEEFRPGDEGVILVNAPQMGFNSVPEVRDVLEVTVEQELRDFVGFIPEKMGELETIRGSPEQSSYALVYVVEDVPDPEVTTTQIEKAIGNILNREGVDHRSVVVHNTRQGGGV